jgi:RNA polymerase sigma-70 factor, ECF subfamily
MSASLVYPGRAVAPASARPASLEEVYREHFASVWRVLRRLGVSSAQLDDAAQDVFLVVKRKLRELEPGAPLRSWIFAIAVRVAREYRRRAARDQTEQLDDSILDDAPSPARLTELQESIRLLHEVLRELDEKKRTVFVLSELEQLSAPEIALVLAVNLNTVYSRLRSAKLQFDAALRRRRAALRSGGSP